MANCWELDGQQCVRVPKTFTWPKPSINAWVISSDDLLSASRAGNGHLIRTEFGDAMVGYAGVVDIQHILKLELYAAWWGMMLAQVRKIDVVMIHMDSHLAVDILNGHAYCPWRVQSLVSKIKYTMAEFKWCNVIHVWQEANQPADFLAR